MFALIDVLIYVHIWVHPHLHLHKGTLTYTLEDLHGTLVVLNDHTSSYNTRMFWTYVNVPKVEYYSVIKTGVD